jgi:predicted permease
VRLALRRIGRSPGFAAGVVLTFALGIGANATMYGIVDRMLLRPPAHIADADRVRRIWIEREDRARNTRGVNEVLGYAQFRDLLAARSFSGIAAYSGQELTVGRGEDATRLRGGLVTGKYFSVLGVRPELGRLLGESDDRVEAPRVAVLGREAWLRHYGGRPETIGSTIDFGEGPYTVVGVAPAGFTGVELSPVDLWLPLVPAGVDLNGNDEWMEHRGWNWIELIGRLAPGVTPEAAAAEATLLHRAGESERIEAGNYDPRASIVAGPVIAGRGPTESPESLVAKWLVGISLIVLLIACANVANLLLARSIQQRREIGIRLALGSSRGRVLAQTITESLLLALLGGAAALAISLVGGAALRRAIFPNISFTGTGMEARTALVVAVLVVIAGVSSALIPALQTSRPELQESLKSGSRSATAPGSRTRSLLTVLQAALSVLLLVGAGLFLRSLHGVRTLDLGLDARGVLLFQPVFSGTSEAVERDFYQRATERLRAIPQVEGASGDVSIPFWSSIATDLRVPGLDSLPSLPSGPPLLHEVGRDYFDVMRIRTLRGRAFEPGDVEGAPRVAVVNETMARVLWPGKDAIGGCLVIGEDGEDAAGEPPCTTVVGVVEDARRFELEEERGMQYYIPLEQNTREMGPLGLLIRARGDEGRAIEAVRREMLALDPMVRYANVRPLQDLIDPLARSWRLGAVVLTVFGALALLVAGIGLYSVLAFSVLQRTFELGIRAAIGASRQRLVALVLGQAFRLVGAGIALGLLLAVIAGPRLEPLLFRVSSRDPATLVFVAVALALVALLAGAWPAWRATRVDPSVALRAE